MPGGQVKKLSFSPDDRLLLATGEDNQMLIWDLQTGVRPAMTPDSKPKSAMHAKPGQDPEGEGPQVGQH